MWFEFKVIAEHSMDWVMAHGLPILIVLIVAYIAHKFAGTLIAHVIRKMVRQGRGSAVAEQKRENTLISVTTGSAGVLIGITALLMILSEFGVDIGPLLAAAGIVGVAVGFGGQYLIRDLISGLFIIIENQYRVGDVVCFDKTCGSVEVITMRMTTLRDLDGTVHHIPHGEVKTVSNLTKQFARVNLDIGVSYAADLEKVIKVVNDVGTALAEDPAWKERIISAPQFLRVEAFADSAVVIKILGDTQPVAQWDVTGELRKRLKIAFDKNGIEIPFPQRVVHMHE